MDANGCKWCYQSVLNLVDEAAGRLLVTNLCNGAHAPQYQEKREHLSHAASRFFGAQSNKINKCILDAPVIRMLAKVLHETLEWV